MRIWGFDLGTTSIGFAAINYDPVHGLGHIDRLGVRIFPEGVTEDKKEPRNKTRRAKRLMRRGLRRRKLRRRLLNQELANAGLLPRFGTMEWRAVMSGDPYALRRDGLARRLEVQELGRAIYHLAKRRGFAGRVIGQKKNDPDEAAAKEDAAKLATEMGERTLGAFLAGQRKKRGRHHTRDMVQFEFEAIWAAQKPYHPVLSNAAFGARVRNLIFFQRPTFWRVNTLSRCQFCPDDQPEPKGSWAGQQFLSLEQLTKLRIAGANSRPLTDEERAILIEHAHRQKTISWNGVRKALRKHWREHAEPETQTFNMEVAKSETGIKGNIVEFELRKIFGEVWDKHPRREAIRREVHQRLWSADYLLVGNARVEIRTAGEVEEMRRKARDEMQRDWGLTEAQADALAKIELPGEWLGWSRTAIREMLPLMNKGHSVGELTRSPDWQVWRERTFPRRQQPTGEILDRLPSHPRAMPQLRNPTVHRALNELRKVVNNLVGLYGRPDMIRVELARELKESKKGRSERLSRNKRQASERKKAVADLREHGISNPGRQDIEKWLLWEESNERCPYTGDHISFDALFGQGQYQIEHIWPRSISLDNNFANKTLCRTDINLQKGNRTPYQAWGNDPDAWHKLKQRLADCRLPEHKVRRFTKDRLAEAGTEDFADRQLADTGWAARAARDLLKRLWPDDGSVAPIETVNGRITAQLRHQWGLDALINHEGYGKSRADHRHHAIDALTVALTSRSYVKRLADWHKAKEIGARAPEFGLPWQGLFDEARIKVAEIVVSHKARRKASGALHAETVMGDTKRNEKTRSANYRLFVTRKNVERLSKSEISTIRDPIVREVVARHVAGNGDDPKKAFPPFPRLPGKNRTDGPEIRSVRLTIKRQPGLVAPIGTGFADLAANHHIVAYRDSRGIVKFDVVSLYQAATRVSARKPVILKEPTPGSAFIMSLSAGDTLAFKDGDGRPRYRIVQSVWANGQIVLLDHTDSSEEQVSKTQPGIASIIDSGAHKVSVDPIGRVRPARD